MDVHRFAKDYFASLTSRLENLDLQTLDRAVEVLDQVKLQGRQVFIFGNGGSAATASHFANDLNKLACAGQPEKFRAIALTDNVPLLTAWGNDASFEEIFSQQLDNLVSDGDVAIGISGSGNSGNVVRALELAKGKGATTVGLLGFDGGRMKEIVDVPVLVQDDHYGRVEDAHGILCHVIANYFCERGG